MYIPKHFDEPSTDAMHGLIRAHPLATLVTLNSKGIEANHIPLIVFDQPSPYGLLHGHVARANPLWHEHPRDADVLAVFHGPESYITPSWYASKADAGKVVPTWNYVSVQARGKLSVIDDAQWLRSQLESLTVHNEKAFTHQWAVADAPHDFTEKLIESIVGIEIIITELKGKWKVSQNRSSRDIKSVTEGLRGHGQDDMANLVQSRNGDAR
ncbi:MAG: FMN-binding negative transcriptional regulator [Burkholderiales bacterium]